MRQPNLHLIKIHIVAPLHEVIPQLLVQGNHDIVFHAGLQHALRSGANFLPNLPSLLVVE